MRAAPPLAVAAAVAFAFAWASVRAPAQQPARNDAVATGATLATQGAGTVTPCASCHGANGEGNPTAGFPRLTGQSATYLQHQLESYANDARTNPVMQPIAKAMSPEQRIAAAAYYASLDGAAAATPAANAATRPAASATSLGRTIATVGVDARDLQACANCHGPEGIGEWATYPALAGQHASYLASALAEWKSGARRTDPSGQMPRIAQALSDAEANAVAAYYSALPPPPQRGSAPTSASTARTGQAIVSGPATAGQGAPVQGVGTEQGAPTSGGTQGVGGPGNATGPRSGAPQGTSQSPARGASGAR